MSAAISVIIPSALKTIPGSEELWLERAIRSVVAQTHPVAEIIVGLDPGVKPPERILDALTPTNPSIRIASGSTKGHQTACNTAVAMAICPLIAFLEDDDTWEPNHLETMLAAMNRHDAGFVTASQIEVDIAGNRQRFFDFPTCSSWLLSRLLWNQVGGFNTRFKIHHDNHFLLRAHEIGARRVHVLEESAPPTGDPSRPWLANLEVYATLDRVPGLKEPTVKRYRHDGAIMNDNPETKKRSALEYACLAVLYDSLGW